MTLRKILHNQRGDTIIEVTIALSILAIVLTSGFLTANRAYLIGQNARERTEIINLAQAQAEQLKNFRDVHTWNTFLGGITTSSNCPSGTSTTCFHMTALGVPAVGPISAVSSNGSIAITSPVIDPGGKFADFEIVYVLTPRGGGVQETNRIPMKLANLDGIIQ
jgi:Tfp pilus assembly protein PilV